MFEWNSIKFHWISEMNVQIIENHQDSLRFFGILRDAFRELINICKILVETVRASLRIFENLEASLRKSPGIIKIFLGFLEMLEGNWQLFSRLSKYLRENPWESLRILKNLKKIIKNLTDSLRFLEMLGDAFSELTIFYKIIEEYERESLRIFKNLEESWRIFKKMIENHLDSVSIFERILKNPSLHCTWSTSASLDETPITRSATVAKFAIQISSFFFLLKKKNRKKIKLSENCSEEANLHTPSERTNGMQIFSFFFSYSSFCPDAFIFCGDHFPNKWRQQCF